MASTIGPNASDKDLAIMKQGAIEPLATAIVASRPESIAKTESDISRSPDLKKDSDDEEKEHVDDIQGPEELPFARFLPIFVGLLVGIFIVSLDNTVVATAQVPLVQNIGGADLISWLPTTFLIGQGAFAIFWGQVLTSFSSKYIFLFNIFLFEVGSLISGVAPSMGAVLAGRTISGIGASGLFSSAIQVMAETTSITSRAMYVGILGAFFCISMIAGPLIGGALTKITWRWVFYINLPVGGLAAFLIFILFESRVPLGMSKTKKPSIWQRLSKLDIVGTVLLAGFTCMIIIPIQEGSRNGWTTVKTWAPICFSVVVFGLIAAWLFYMDEDRTMVPLRLFRDMNLIGCALTSFLTFWNIILFMYLIPYYYEAVRGHSATKSGVDMLALMIVVALGSMLSGVVAKKSGHYYPQMLLFPLFGCIGAGLLYTTRINSGIGLQIGTQILLGAAMGPVIQGPMLTVQANTEKRLISKATSFTIYAQRIGGGIGSSISGAIIAAQLPGAIKEFLPDNVDPTPYMHIEPTAVFDMPHGPIRDAILRALNSVIDDVALVGIPIFFLVFLSVLTLVRIKNIKTQKVTRKMDLLRKCFGLSKGKIEVDVA